MEERQNQQTTEQPSRRRRAVRSVPMGVQDEPTVASSVTAAVTPTAAEKPMAVEKPAAEAPAATEKPTAEKNAVPTAAVPRVPSAPQTAPREPKPAAVPPQNRVNAETPAKRVAGADVRDTQKQPQTPTQRPVPPAAAPQIPREDKSVHEKPHPTTQRRWGLSCILAVILVVGLGALAAFAPFLGKTEAVMLYIDETAIGWIADADAVDAQAARLRGELNGALSASAETLPYRCETAQAQGEISVLSSEEIYDALHARATEGYVRAYRLVPLAENGGDLGIGASIGIMTEAEILASLEAAQAFYRAQYTPNLPTGATLSVTPRFTWETAWIAEHEIVGENTLTALLTEGADASSLLSVTASMIQTEAQRIPYETTLVPNDENFDGIRTMISAGADGLAQVSYTVALDVMTGTELSRVESARTVVREPIAAVSYEGLYPLPEGVSTGTFDWPLPELPDRDLPLDENGNPYMPENSLALKRTYVSSVYGERDLWGSYDFHLGLDIVAPAYTEIYASDGGVVVFAAYTSSYGYMTRIRHANNVETVYAHQIKQEVKPGDVVQKGQLIGYVGSTGNSSGSHLHLEFRRDHVTVDPAEYITVPEDVLVLGEGY